MNLIMTLLVRNEEDILESNLRFHYSQGVSFVIATDNKSTDATADILKHYEKMGLLHYIYEESDDYSQWVWVTRMARIAAEKYGADWIINNDADEFWLPQLGRLSDILEQQSNHITGLRCQRLNFFPYPENHPHGNKPFWERMIYRQIASTNTLGLPLPGKVCHRGSNSVVVSQGNHRVANLSGEQIDTDQIEIFHYPIRTFRQFESKIALGGAAYERNLTLPSETGKSWRQLYELHKSGKLKAWYDSCLYDSQLETQLLEHDANATRDTRLREYFYQYL